MKKKRIDINKHGKYLLLLSKIKSANKQDFWDFFKSEKELIQKIEEGEKYNYDLYLASRRNIEH